MVKPSKVNLDRVKQELRKAQSKADKRGVLWWKPKEGENLIRILPPWSAEGVFGKEAGYHYNVAQDSAVACPRVCKGLPCPVCEAVADLFKGRKSEDIASARKISVRMRYFYNVLDRDAKDGKVYVYGSPVTVYEELLGIFADKDYGDITDVNEGYDVKLIKTGEGLDTRYTVRPAKKPSVVVKWDEKKKKLVDLDSIVESDLMTYDRLKALLEGTADSTEEEDEVEEAEKETEEEESEEEEAEVAKAPPKGKSKTALKAPVKEEAEEEEEESEEETEEKPAEESSEEESETETETEEATESEETEESDDEEPKGKKGSKDDAEDEDTASVLERLRKMRKGGKK